MKKYKVYTHADFVFAEYIEAESEEQALEIHNQHKDMSAGSDWEFCDDIDTQVEEEKPSLEDIFDIKAANERSKREQKRRELMTMDAQERAWIDEMVDKLAFLRSHGIQVKPYFGGIVDGWPYNYITIGSRNGRWVEIKGSTVRRKDNLIDHLSPYIYNTEKLTLEDVVKRVAEWYN